MSVRTAGQITCIAFYCESESTKGPIKRNTYIYRGIKHVYITFYCESESTKDPIKRNETYNTCVPQEYMKTVKCNDLNS